jgi:murein DD-endopeptidase MepM/ murein hydrolase activator NlpD
MRTRSFLSLLHIVLLLVLTLQPHYLVAQTQEENESPEVLQANLNALSAQITALDKEIQAYNKKISQTQGEAKTLKQALQKLEQRRVALSKDIDYTKLRISRAATNIAYTKNKINATENVLTRNKRALAESMRVLVQSESYIPTYVSALAPGAQLSDTLEISQRTHQASHAIDDRVRDLMDAKRALTIQKASFESQKRTLEDLNKTLSAQKGLVEATSKEKSSLLVETKNKETEYQKLLASRKAKKEQLEDEMLDVESKLRVAVDASKLPKTGKGVLQYPVKDVTITQYFGNTPFASKNPQVYNGGGHNGIDFSARIGTPIYSAEAGTVLGTGNTDTSCNGVSYGKWVLIQHNNGLTTLYAHLSTIQTYAGAKVGAREKIGLSGNTGYSTGPHLHFTVYASDSVKISNYVSKVCGTTITMPLAPRAGYLNPLSYL